MDEDDIDIDEFMNNFTFEAFMDTMMEDMDVLFGYLIRLGIR